MAAVSSVPLLSVQQGSHSSEQESPLHLPSLLSPEDIPTQLPIASTSCSVPLVKGSTHQVVPVGKESPQHFHSLS